MYDAHKLLMAAAYDGDGNRVFMLNYNPDKDEDFTDYYNSYQNKDYTGTGVLFPVCEEVGEVEQELLNLIKDQENVKYELIEYLTDVNREYAQALVEQNLNGKTDTTYTYGVDRISKELFDCESYTSYYLYDPRGSVTGLTNRKGQLCRTYQYDSYGELTRGKAQYENAYTYNGESYNPNIETLYLRARYYSVVTANFLTEDSYLGNINEPLTLNRYSYCLASPLNYVDPSGHWVYIDEVEEIRSGYEDMKKGEKKAKGTPDVQQIQTFLSALHELNIPYASVDFVLHYNYNQNYSYIAYAEKLAQKRNKGFACDIIYERDFFKMQFSQQGIEALMYWETVNSYAKARGYLIIEEIDGKQFLRGVKPHDVGDGSITSGFGDFLTADDVEFYEGKGYTIHQSKNSKKISIEEDFVSIDVVVEKYQNDISALQKNLEKNLKESMQERGIQNLRLNQRMYDALVIMRYQLGSLGTSSTDLILNKEQDSQKWIEFLDSKRNGGQHDRTMWEINQIMFGNKDYLSTEYFTPLTDVIVEGITD